MSDMHKLLNAFCFDVMLSGETVGFKSVKGIKLASAFEPLQVGGMNDGPVMLPVPVKEIGRLTLERGKSKTRNVRLPSPGTKLDNLIVQVYDEDGVCGAAYSLDSPVVEAIEVGAMDAMSSGILIETLTVSFRKISECEN